MGTGRGGTGPKSKSKKKFYKKHTLNVKRRGKDIDQIQDEIAAIAAGGKDMTQFHDADAPGGGHFFCLHCSRHFINSDALKVHNTTKAHKKRVKIVAEEQYTQKEADAGAGMSS